MGRRLAVLLLATLVGAALYTQRAPLMEAAAHFLIVQDPIEPADIIIVLSGGQRDERVRQAAELFHARQAPRVLLSGGEEQVGLVTPELLRRQARQHRIPESALLYERESTSTAEQARYLRPILEQRGFRRAIVVTSSYHTRRTRYLFRKAFAESPVEIRVYPVQKDFFSPVRWWTRDRDTEEFVLEYIKLALAVARYR
jgi:uncharacterized SAM-binding protein YcdF (DUF218 family)